MLQSLKEPFIEFCTVNFVWEERVMNIKKFRKENPRTIKLTNMLAGLRLAHARVPAFRWHPGPTGPKRPFGPDLKTCDKQTYR